jgi:hypothetical protein
MSFIIVLASFTHLFGQQVEWQKGVVVLQGGRVINGTINYPKGFALIFIKNDQEKVVLTADKVRLFRYYDSASNVNRRFISIVHGKWGSQFYEEVVTGEVSILRELKKYANKYHPDEIDSYRYFVLIGNLMVPMMHFRNKVYPKLMEEHGSEIQAFVHRLRLNPNEMKSAILIIEEYNRIAQMSLQAMAGAAGGTD